MDVWGRKNCGYVGYRKFGLAGPFLHGGRNRCSVYMCVARLIRRRCSLVWHGTLPRRDWSPIKVSATFILGQGERLRATVFFSRDLLLLLWSHVTRIRDRRCRTQRRTHVAISWCSFVGIFFLLLFFLRERLGGRIWWICEFGDCDGGNWNGIPRWFEVNLNNFEWFVYIHVEKLNLKK